MMNSVLFKEWQKAAQQQTEHILLRMLPEKTSPSSVLHDAMRYAVLGGGKRLRPMLVLASAHLGRAVQPACEAAMAAVECIHVYSLVHDDMPEMDNDSLRRGKPTVHVQFDAATALLTGDALQTLAFDCLSRPTTLPIHRQLRMIQVLAHASGNQGMALGQAIDLAHVGKTMNQRDLEHMHALKTGALIRASVQLGALSCPDLTDSQLDLLDNYAQKLGLAFQVMDDVLDYSADTATLGKTAGKDADANKPTYVQLLGTNAAQQYAIDLIHESQAALTDFDERADYLRQLAQFVVQRAY